MGAYLRGTPADRLNYRVELSEDGCWIWTGAVTTDGYGNIGHPPHVELPTSTHRLAWTLAYGPIPDGAYVLHRCDVRRCVNPEHLFLGSHADNMRDMAEKGRGFSPRRLLTHCKHGHEFTEQNTYRRSNGARTCRTCHRDHARAARAARSAPRDQIVRED